MKKFILTAAILCMSLLAASAQDFKGKIPSNFSVELSFAEGWPFATPYVKPASQSDEGEVYEYVLKQGKNGASLFFTLCKGPNGNTYSVPKKTVHLDFKRPEEKPDNCGYIKLPGVDGRYIKQVEITVPTKNTNILFCTDAKKVKKGNGLVATLKVPDNGTESIVLTPEQIAAGAPLYLYRVSSGPFRMSSIKVTYATAKNKGKKK